MNKKILIIEDNKQIQDTYKKKFELEGFEVIQAITGRDGLDLSKSSSPDLIILDIMLPGALNGEDVLKKLKADENLKNIPVIILTNLDTEEEYTMKQGATDYIVKDNVSIDGVVERVKRYIRLFSKKSFKE